MTDLDQTAPLPSYDTPQAIRFLEAFHPKGPFHLVAIGPDGKVEPRSFTSPQRESMRHWIDERQGIANLYFHVNQLRPDFANRKAKKADVVAVTHLHVDADRLGPEIIHSIASMEPKPTVVVFSGGGYQVYFALDVPCLDLDRAERCNLALAHTLGGDKVQNVDRIMRLPGTLNIPNEKKRRLGRTVALAYIIDDLTDGSRRCSIHQFAEAEDTRGFGVVIPADEVSLVEVHDLPATISEFTKNLIQVGDDTKAPIGTAGARYRSRSEALFRVICDLVRADCSPEVVAGVILNPAHGISASVLDKTDPKAYAFKQVQAGQDAVGDTWPDVGKGGLPRPTLRNTMLAIRRLELHCEYDEFKHRKIMGGHVLQTFAGELSDDGCAMLRKLILQKFGFDPGKENSREAANILCLENAYHPIRDYLNAQRWDGAPRLGTWLSTYLGAEDTPLNRVIGQLMLIAAVRRVREPGVKFDQIIVLEGAQGTGKSTALEILAGGQGNFSDAEILTLDPKAQMEALDGVWIYEISELEGISRADTQKVKAFASRSVDRGRPAYARFREDRPRQVLLVGTTNDDKYLRDQTGNRRFWPIRTGTIDLAGLRRDRDQLWAEAAQLEADGASLVLPESLWAMAAREQEERVEDDPWLHTLAGVEGDVVGGFERVATDFLLSIQLNLEPHQQQQFHTKRIALLMRKLGWAGPKRIRMHDGRVVRGYERPTTKPPGPQPVEF